MTSNKLTQNLTLPNVKIINGEWGSLDVPDKRLKKFIYRQGFVFCL